MAQKPDYLKSGEPARLFPVLSTTSKEGRTTSIVLACMVRVEEFGRSLMGSIGQKVGVRSRMEAYTEVVFANHCKAPADRPDGLLVITNGSRTWRALIETKVGNSVLDADQIERYRSLAKENGIDCVITISNQFTASPQNHPIEDLRRRKSKIPVYHWSWMYILTESDLLLNNSSVRDSDQAVLLNELRRFLTHESAGVKGFDRMPPEWAELNRLVSAGGTVAARSEMAAKVVEAWHQETRDLSLILSRQTETAVDIKLPRRHIADPSERTKADLQLLRDTGSLSVSLDIPNAAARLEVTANIARRAIDVGMTLKAPADRVSSRARMNWLLRQVRSKKTEDLHLRLIWPGKSENTQFLYDELTADPSIVDEGKAHLTLLGFHVFYSRRLGERFVQQTNFVNDLEEVVPEFYREIGQYLSAWREPAPRIKPDRSTPDSVDVDAMEEEANEVADEVRA